MWVKGTAEKSSGIGRGRRIIKNSLFHAVIDSNMDMQINNDTQYARKSIRIIIKKFTEIRSPYRIIECFHASIYCLNVHFICF